MGILGSIADGGRYLGRKAEQGFNFLFEDRTDNEFRDIDRGNFDAPGFEDRQNRLLGHADRMQGRNAPQLGQFNQAGDSAFRGDQSALVDQLRRQMSGQDSMAALQLRQQADRNIGQQQAMAASARPGQGAMAARMASQNAGRINQGLAGQAQQAMTAERLGAAGALGGVLQGARGQDLAHNQWNAGQLNQALLAQGQMQMQQQGMNDQALLALLQQEQQNAGMQQQGGMGYEGARGQRFGTIAGTPTRGEQVLGGIASLGAMFGSSGGGK